MIYGMSLSKYERSLKGVAERAGTLGFLKGVMVMVYSNRSKDAMIKCYMLFYYIDLRSKINRVCLLESGQF